MACCAPIGAQIKLLKRKELENSACPCYEIIWRHVDRLLLHSHVSKEEGI
jgi:hypothetical protein